MITLRGKVLPIGGPKEKLLTSHRGDLRGHFWKDNEKDMADLPENLRQAMKLHFVETMDEVLQIALEGPLSEAKPSVFIPHHAETEGTAARQ